MRKVTPTGIDHGLLDGLGILPRPLLDLLVHLRDLLRVHGPQTALPLVSSIRRRFFNFLKTLI